MKPQKFKLRSRVLKAGLRYFLSAVFFLAVTLPATLHAQVKIGDQASDITPSAILELNSTAQGFLLPRISDWTIDAVFGSHPKGIPDGMMVYLDDNSDTTGIYIRKNGVWTRVTTSENEEQRLWSRSGNTLGTGSDTLGFLDNSDLKIITNGEQRILLTANGLVNFTTDTVAMRGRLSVGGQAWIDSALHVSDTVYAEGIQTTGRAVIEGDLVLPNVAGQSPFTEVLVIDTATGVVTRRTIDPDVFKGWTVGNFDETGNAAGLELRPSANGTDKDTLILHAANENTPGGVSVTDQNFAGNKTFVDSVAVDGTLLIGNTGTATRGTLQVDGSVSLKVRAITATGTIADDDYTVLVSQNNITVSLPTPGGTNEGRVYIVKKTAATNFSQPVTLSGDIEGVAANMEIYNQGTSLKLQSDGATWWIVDRM